LEKFLKVRVAKRKEIADKKKAAAAKRAAAQKAKGKFVDYSLVYEN